MRPSPDPVSQGQESVWSYPRPPIAQASAAHVVIIHAGLLVAETRSAVRTLETSHPPTWYIPASGMREGALRRTAGGSFCEWKGEAIYWDVVLGDLTFAKVGWSYPDPNAGFEALRDHVAFYAAPFDACLVDGEVVTPQPGGFYGGWITSAVAGPFKGVPGSRFW